MNFNQLDLQTKESLHQELNTYATKLGGKNFFLQLIEDAKREKTHPLLNKSCIYHFSKGRVSWSKSIYKDTLDLLIKTIKLDEADENFLKSINNKTNKKTLNMIRALKPVTIEIKPKQREEGEGFEISIIDASNEDEMKISLVYKIIFFYNIDFAKQALNYKATN